MSVIKYPGFLKRETIEHKAESVLEQMRVMPNYAPEFPIDPTRVAEFLELDVLWIEIPADAQGQIAARILPKQRLIEINDTIEALRGGFGNSTIAHEVGHWILHINHDEVDGLTQQQELNLGLETIQPFLCRSMNTNDSIEWQAQYFASCLLMPQFALMDAARGRTLTKLSHLYAMAEDFGVTISNLKNRLQGLGWIDQPQGKQIYLGKAALQGQLKLLE